MSEDLTRLAFLYRSRAANPRSIMALRTFGPLSDREFDLVVALMTTVAIDLEHCQEYDRQTEILERLEGLKIPAPDPLRESAHGWRTPTDAAIFYGVSRNTLYNWIREGKVRCEQSLSLKRRVVWCERRAAREAA